MAELFFWNDWALMPALLLAAIYSLAKLRKPSLAVLAAGLCIYIGSSVVLLFYTNPLNLVHSGSLVAQSVGFLVGLAGFVWFWLKDRATQSVQSNNTPERDARKSNARPSP